MAADGISTLLTFSKLSSNSSKSTLFQMQSAEIGPIDQLNLIGHGMTNPRFAILSPNLSAVVKKSYPQHGITANAEVAAYLLDQFFGGIVNVPKTVMRSLDDHVYSLQEYIPETAPVASVDLKKYRKNLWFFDFLIDNTDRRHPNLLSDGSSYYAIDHGISFRSIYAEGKLKNTENAWSLKLNKCCSNWFQSGFKDAEVQSVILKSLPEKHIYDHFKAASIDQFYSLFDGTLPTKEIDFFLKRRKVFIDTVENWLSNGGVYPSYDQ